jgi:hypothetical protein
MSIPDYPTISLYSRHLVLRRFEMGITRRQQKGSSLYSEADGCQEEMLATIHRKRIIDVVLISRRSLLELCSGGVWFSIEQSSKCIVATTVRHMIPSDQLVDSTKVLPTVMQLILVREGKNLLENFLD